MSEDTASLGTLIVVVLKARNLPNKRHIGKQDPYCAVEFNNDKRRTKALRRGGQHPEWDEELRFTLFEDDDIKPAPSQNGDDIPPPLPPKKPTKRSIQGGNSMRIACYADDPREPELIGEATVDLTEVLTKGETDEWFTIYSKDKYCGEVYLELTFWSNDKPPEKKYASKTSVMNSNYGGPGSFQPAPDGSHSRNGSQREDSGVISTSSSLARISLYEPPYERQDSPTSSHFGYSTNGRPYSSSISRVSVRRESYPPLHHAPVTTVYSNQSEFSPVHVGPSQYDDRQYQPSMLSYDPNPVYIGGEPTMSYPPSVTTPVLPPWNGQPQRPLIGHHSSPSVSTIHNTYQGNDGYYPLPSSDFDPPRSDDYNYSLSNHNYPQTSFSRMPTIHHEDHYSSGTFPPQPSHTPISPASAPPVYPTTPPSVPPLSHSAPPGPPGPVPISAINPASVPWPAQEPRPSPTQGRPLPEPYRSTFGQPTHSLPTTPPTHSFHTLNQSLPSTQNRPTFPIPGLPPPLPETPPRRAPLPFTPPPPPPPLPNVQNPPPVQPSSSFDFSANPHLTSSMSNQLSNPHRTTSIHSSASSSTIIYPGPPPPPPTSYM